MAPKVERHTTTQAAQTTTKPEATPRPGRTPAHIQAEQHALTERSHVKAPPAPTPSVPATVPAQSTGVVSAEALERNLAALGSVPLTPITFDGNTGEFKTPDGPIPAGSLFVAVVPQTRVGFIRFNGPGQQPDVEMRGIAEEGDLLTRDDLPGGYDEAPGPDGQPREAWQQQTALPLLDTSDGQEMYVFTARNKVSLIAVENLLGRYRFHPKAKDGALPIIKLNAGEYTNKKFGTKKPKPVLQLCGWTGPDGKSPPPPAAEKPPFNDEIGI
jgi:hypothetical protein